MASKKKPMDLSTLQGKVANEARDSIAYLGGDISNERMRALQYYFSEAVGDLSILDENRSKVISSDVSDTIEWILPSLLRIFTAGDDIVRFEPQNPQDDAVSKQATEACNYVLQKDNPGFLILYTWFKDAILQKNGIVKTWWEVKETNETRTVYDLDDDSYVLLLNDPDVEILAHTENSSNEVGDGSDPSAANGAVEPASPSQPAPAPTNPVMPPQAPQMPPMAPPVPMPPVLTHDVQYRKKTEKGKVCIENVPPEEFLISRDAKNIGDSAFCAHRKMRTVSDLIAEGYDKTQVSELPSDDVGYDNPEAVARRDTDESDYMPLDRQGVMRSVWVTESYIRADFDGDGIAELRKVVCGGPAYEILKLNGQPDNELWEGPPPFSSVTPIIQPHKFFGRAVADLVIMYQNVKTALLRGTLDNLYLTNNPRNVVSESVNLDDYMDPRPGGAVRLLNGAKPSDGHIVALEVPFVANATFNMLEELDSMKENAVGVTKYNQGMDANSLNKTASGITQIMQASQSRLELIARIFAETGVKDLFKQILHCLMKYQDKARMIRLRGEWVPMDPAEWDTEFDMTINVGLGTGNKDQMLGHLTTILGMQTQALQFQLQTGTGLNGPLVTGENIYNTAAKIVENSGLKSPELYFTDPKNVQMPPQQPKPDPEMIKVQQQGQIQQQQLQLDAWKAQQQHQLDTAKLQGDFQLKQQDQLANHALKHDQNQSLQKPSTNVQFDASGSLDGVTQAITQLAANQQQFAEQQSAVMAQAAQAIAQAAQVMAQAAQTMSSPKRVVRGPDGKVAGVEPVSVQ